MYKDTDISPKTKSKPTKLIPQSSSQHRHRISSAVNPDLVKRNLADMIVNFICENTDLISESLLDHQNHAEFKEERQIFGVRSKDYNIIVITNKGSIHKSKFGEKYRQSLHPKDQTLTHPFEFVLKVTALANSFNSFVESPVYQKLTQSIEEYIVDVVENVVSVSFNYLVEGKLKED